MCMIEDRADADKIKDKSHLEVMIHHKGYGVLKDSDLELYYFAKIDIHFNPLKLYDGSEKSVYRMFIIYFEHNKLDWSILDEL